ncbi:MAG TPA: hypothetical protein VGP88_07620 [Thermoplasmata archaeon]|jgi:hypothetical protein|nr:hypothetical protein [Thermoplasmata archaeon]
MRKGLVVIGVILLIVGLLAAGLTFQQTSSATIPQTPSAEVATLGSVTAGSMMVTWSGGTSASVIDVYSGSGCGSGTPVASGTGSSGSFTFSVSSGATYSLCTTAGPTVSATLQIDGFVPLTFIGIVLAAIGAFLLVVGIMAKPRTRAAPAEVGPASPPAAPARSSAPMSNAATEGDQGYIMQAAPSAPEVAQGNRPMIKCASCGTLNQPWLHNCRQCQRALTSTLDAA